MFKKTAIAVLFLTFFAGSAFAKPVLPKWVKEQMVDREEKPASIKLYRTKSGDFYLFNPPTGTTGYYQEVYNTKGAYVCAPTGGTFGEGDGNCEGKIGELDKPVAAWSKKDY